MAAVARPAPYDPSGRRRAGGTRRLVYSSRYQVGIVFFLKYTFFSYIGLFLNIFRITPGLTNDIHVDDYFHMHFYLQFEEGVDILVQVDVYEKHGSESDIKKEDGDSCKKQT